MILNFRKPSSDELELIILSTTAIGVTYYSSPNFNKFLGAVIWNLAGKLVTRLAKKYYNPDIDEGIIRKLWDAPLNVATTSFLSSGLEKKIATIGDGFDVNTSTYGVLAKSISYGIIGQIFKDCANKLTEAFIPINSSIVKKKSNNVSEAPQHKYLNNCSSNFLVQLTKNIINPSELSNWQHNVQHIVTGVAKHSATRCFIGGYNTPIDAVVMGALNFCCYLLPLKFIPKTVTSLYTVKSATVIAIEMSEKMILEYTKGSPISGLFKGRETSKKLKIH